MPKQLWVGIGMTMSFGAAQLKQKLMLHRIGGRMLKATCSPTRIVSPTSSLWTVLLHFSIICQ
jgi:hypothetical protein